MITGIQLDMLGEQRKLMEPLQTLIETDESLYGVDEILSFSIVNLYGSIGYTNYGYIDKIKPGVLARLNDKSTGECHTFWMISSERLRQPHPADWRIEQKMRNKPLKNTCP